MIKQLLILFLITAFTAQTFNRTFIVVDYYTNTNNFIKNCENKAKPQLHCNGHCQLMKKLKQQDNKDQQNPERRNNNKDEVISSKSFFASVQHPISFTTAHYFLQNNNAVKDIPQDFFHPPGA